MIYPRHVIIAPGAGEAELPRGAEQLWLTIEGKQVEAWLLPPFEYPAGGQAPLFIFAHANAEVIDEWPPHVQSLREMGFAVLLVEFPGYGRSEGEPTQGSITEAMVKAYDSVVARDDIDRERIVVFGRSLGGGAACALTKERKVQTLILVSTFTSIRDMAGRYFLPSFLILDPFNNLEVVREFDGKVLVVHGLQDEIFPYSMGERLAAAAQDGELLTYNCGHNDCIVDWNSFWREQTAFFKEADILP
jgi:pimeloyl-ACP methyl ester carboxylesterase